MARRKAWTIAVTSVLAGLLVVLIFRPTGGSLSVAERDFNAWLRQAVDRGERTIDVASLTDFQWRRVCFIGPYANPKQFKDEERKQLAAQGALDLAWVGSEGNWGLIFTGPASETSAIRIPTKHVDTPSSYSLLAAQGIPVETEQRTSCFGRDEAVLLLFQYERRNYAFLTRR